MLILQELYMEEDQSGKLNKQMYTVMEKVMRPVGQLLCTSKLEDGSHAGPTFEPVVFQSGTNHIVTLKKLMSDVLKEFPEEKTLQKKMNQKVMDSL